MVSIVGKAMAVFPEACNNLVLRGNAADPSSRRDFFILAVLEGHIELVKRLLDEEKLALEGEKKGLRNMYKALQAACDQLNIDMIELLTSRGFSPRDEEGGINNLLSVCISKFATAPIQAAMVIRHLLEKTDYFDEGQTNNHIVCPLRLLINTTMSNKAPAALEAVLPYFVKKGFNIDLVDQTKITSLDYAIAKKNIRLIEQLISLGGGKTIDAKAALTFFKSHPKLNDLFETLKKNSLLISWHSELANFICTDGIGASNLHIPEFGNCYLAPNTFTESENKSYFTGSSQLEIKKWVNKDVSRRAAEELFRLLIGHGITNSCFATHAYEGPGAFGALWPT